MFSWLTSIAKQSDKYSEKVKITNYRYFQLSISQLNVATLQAFVAHATQQVQDSTLRYLAWMVEYEFPSLSLLAVRLDGVGGRVTDEELSLYIRRKDVLNVMKELEGKSLDTIVFNLYKRIEKHFRSDFDQVRYLLYSDDFTFPCHIVNDDYVVIVIGIEVVISIMGSIERSYDKYFHQIGNCCFI